MKRIVGGEGEGHLGRAFLRERKGVNIKRAVYKVAPE